MKRFIPLGIGAIIIALAIIFQKPAEPGVNPDPNHTHADFAVWVNGEKLVFSGEEFMSGSASDETHERALHPYLHLHDGIGHVIHRHKPGLSVLEFLQSVGVAVRENELEPERSCFIFPQLDNEVCEEGFHDFFIYTNDPRQGFAQFLNDDYIFDDLDQILITNGTATTSEDINAMSAQWLELTNDACLYSRTCPERGDPPAENCIADPAIPCVIPE